MDRKYGRVFTMSDVEKILDTVINMGGNLEDTFDGGEHLYGVVVPDMDAAGVRFKFDKDEPTFTLRGRDQRAIAAIRYYSDHQSPNAPIGFLDGIQGALSEFERYRHEHPAMMKQPD